MRDFWDYAAIAFAVSLVRNAEHQGRGWDPIIVARTAAQAADKLEEERAKRTAGSKPS